MKQKHKSHSALGRSGLGALVALILSMPSGISAKSPERDPAALPRPLPRQIVQKVISEESTAQIVPYDITSEFMDQFYHNHPQEVCCDDEDYAAKNRKKCGPEAFPILMGGAHGGYQYFCFGCKAARFRTKDKEYMLVAYYNDDSLVVYEPDEKRWTPVIHQSLSIYECSHKKSHHKRTCKEVDELPCIYGDRYRKFIDGNADARLDAIVVERGEKTYKYYFGKGIVETFRYSKSNWPLSERKIREKDKRRRQQEYETLLRLIANDYGI